MSRQRTVLPPDATVADYPAVAGQLHPDSGPATHIPARSGVPVRWVCPAGPDHQWEAPPYRRLAAGSGCPACAGKQVSVTNSLLARFPDVAAELDVTAAATGVLSAAQLLAGSHRRVGWCCSACGHRWVAQVGSRTGSRRSGCPACAGHVATSTRNLAALAPQVAGQWHPTRNQELQPTDVTPASTTPVWWRCPAGPDHEWVATPNARTRAERPTGCPACAGKQLSLTTTLASCYPDLASQLDADLNDGLTADRVLVGTAAKVWWRCQRGPDHVWSATVVSRTAGRNGCPYCAGRRASVTNALALHPDLVAQFDLAANFPHTPQTLASTSRRRVTWRCPAGPTHVWSTTVAGRAVDGRGCSYCSGNKLSPERSLAAASPTAAAQLRPDLNAGLTPSQVSAGSNRVVTWSCPGDPGHTWATTVASRVAALRRGAGMCPHCHPTPAGRSWRQLAVASALAHALPTLHVDPHPAGIRAAGRLRHVDLAVPELRLLVEYDGVYFHRARAAHDAEKADALRDAGWTVVRLREHDLPALHPHDLTIPVLAPTAADQVAAAVLAHLEHVLPPPAVQKLQAAQTAAQQAALQVGPWVWVPPAAAALEAISALEAFVDREGHARVPTEHVEAGVPLGRWVLRQRHLRRTGRLQADQVALLEGIPGWVWDWREHRWQMFVDALARYSDREGHLRIPQSHQELDYALGAKVASIRSAYRRGRVRPAHVAYLETLIGWEWAPGRAAAPGTGRRAARGAGGSPRS